MDNIPDAPREHDREPTNEDVLRLMSSDELRLYNSVDVPEAQRQGVYDFYRAKWKEANSDPHNSEAPVVGEGVRRIEEILRMDPRAIDAKYRSFPSFADWSKTDIDTARWDDHVKALSEWTSPSPELLRKARGIVTRAAAIDTGALEHLYEVDKGFTFTVATEAATWEAALDKKGPEVRALIESQMDAYEMVLDFATQKQSIAEAWIRELHAEICKSQKTYSALTEIGWQELPLPKGRYKVSPNHVRGRDGEVHAYAPVDRVSDEMQKLVQELRTEEFANAHPVLQASYAHYAFVLIHPFADGNGRVARALASVYTYRAESIPLLILIENRDGYIEALSEADRGNFRPFVNFVFERALDAIRLTEMSLRAASATSIEQALNRYKRLFVTKGGYTHEAVDFAGYALIELVTEELKSRSQAVTESGAITVQINRENRNDYRLSRPETTRHPIAESGRRLVIRLVGTDVRHPTTDVEIDLAVPKDCDVEDEILLATQGISLPFSARITELIPDPSAALKLRVSIYAETLLSMAVNRLITVARKSLKNQGFLS